jgi:hypothetical protein
MARKVSDPQGVEWKVGRQWAPWRVKVIRERPDLGDGAGGGGDWFAVDDAAGILVALGVLVAIALAFFVIWPIVAIAIEIVLVALGVLVTAVGRVVLRKPWTVRAMSRGREPALWRVRGWRTSGELVDEVADAIAAGRELPLTGRTSTSTGSPIAAQ